MKRFIYGTKCFQPKEEMDFLENKTSHLKVTAEIQREGSMNFTKHYYLSSGPTLQAQAQGGFGISLEMSFIFSLLAYQLS